MKPPAKLLPRNEEARALHIRVGNAAVAVRVDARPKIITPRKGKRPYQRRDRNFTDEEQYLRCD